MPNTAADHSILLAVLARQAELIRDDDLIAALREWAPDRSRPLGQFLTERGSLTPERLARLEALARVRLEQHGGDVRACLAAVGVPPSLREEVARLGDGELTEALPPATEATLAVRAADATGSWAGRTDAPTLTWPPTPPNEPRASLPLTQNLAVVRPHPGSGTGPAFVARDAQLGREVLVKELRAEQAARPELRARFLREAEVAARLDHPGVAPVYGLGTHADGRPFYATRLVEGETLRDAVAALHRSAADLPAGERSLALRQLLTRFVAACHTLAHAHARGVVHRDLKPQSIVLGRHGETVVTDWSLARVFAGAQRGADVETEIFAGGASKRTADHDTQMTLDEFSGAAFAAAPTLPAYVSPEMAAGGFAELAPAADVYSLGATLYHLLTGRPPFEGESASILLRVQRGDLKRPRQLKPDVPRALEAICLKAMALRPQARYSSADALARDVERWLAGEPVGAYPEGFWARLRRRRWVGAAALALLLAAVGAGGFVAARALAGEPEPPPPAAPDTKANERAERAEQARKQAQANFEAAHLAVEDYLARLGEDPRLKERDLSALRRGLLGKAADYYENYLAGAKDDPTQEAAVAKARAALGMVRRELFDTPKAAEQFREARTAFLKLGERDKDNREYQYYLGFCCVHLGDLDREARRLAEGEKLYREAIEALARGHDARSRRELGAAHAGLARVLLAKGNPRAARDEGRKAVAAFARLAKEEALAADHHYRLADACDQLAAALEKLKEPHKEVARQGAAALEQLGKRAEDMRYRSLVASLQKRLGDTAVAAAAGLEFRDKITNDDPLDEFLLTKLDKKSRRKVHTAKLAAGKHYQIDLEAKFDTFLRVESADGRHLLYNDDVYLPAKSLNSRLVFTPREAGTYRLIVTSYDSATGDYRLRVTEVMPAAKPVIVRGELTEKDTKDKTSGVYFRAEKVELVAGRPYTVELDSSAFEPVVVVFHPAIKEPVVVDSANGRGGLPARVDLTPPTSGTYFIQIVGGRNGEIGQYTLRVQGYQLAGKGPMPAPE